jgi:hypothetical protein
MVRQAASDYLTPQKDSNTERTVQFTHLQSQHDALISVQHESVCTNDMEEECFSVEEIILQLVITPQGKATQKSSIIQHATQLHS